MTTAEQEVVRLRETLNRIAFLSTNHGGWFETDPFGSYVELGEIAANAHAESLTILPSLPRDPA